VDWIDLGTGRGAVSEIPLIGGDPGCRYREVGEGHLERSGASYLVSGEVGGNDCRPDVVDTLGVEGVEEVGAGSAWVDAGDGPHAVALNPLGVVVQAVERKNSQTFIEFLEYLVVENYPHQKIILVLDNASYHRSQASLAALSLFQPRVQVVWLPKYCPNLNLIERFWRHLKDLACANRLDITLESIISRVEQIMQYQNSETHPLKLSFLDNFV